jgi:membrane protein YdbS with pleckstrin-like domain
LRLEQNEEKEKMNTINIVEEQKSKIYILGIYPRCPFYNSATAVLIILALITLGTIGIYLLNFWAAVAFLAYSILWYFVVMPYTLCKYCYYKVKETTVDKETGKATERLMPIEKWRETNGIDKHVGQKNWTYCMSIVWLLPIVLIVISFFSNFSIYALATLVGFLGVLVGNYYYMLRKKCPSCAIRDECHAAF